MQILKESINTIYVNYIGSDEIEKMPIYYIGGSQTLPPPLSQEEEETVLNSLAKGDELAKKTLVERNLENKTCNICFEMYRKWNTNAFKKKQ